MRIKILGVLLILAFLIAGLSTISADDTITASVTTPTAGNYWADGTHTITFKVTDDNALATDLNTKIYYSASAGAFTTNIADVNLYADGVCSGTDFTTEKTCTYSWDQSVATDGNYYIDINVINLTDNNFGTASSSSFYVDNTNPAKVVSFGVNGLHDGKFHIFWDYNSSSPPTEFASYVIKYSTSEMTTCNGSTLTTITNAATNSYDATGLSTNTPYWFCATKKDVAGNEDTSTRIVYGSSTKAVLAAIPPQGGTAGGSSTPSQPSQSLNFASITMPISLAIASVTAGNYMASIPVGTVKVPAIILLLVILGIAWYIYTKFF